jgi:hypothetical protein
VSDMQVANRNALESFSSKEEPTAAFLLEAEEATSVASVWTRSKRYAGREPERS